MRRRLQADEAILNGFKVKLTHRTLGDKFDPTNATVLTIILNEEDPDPMVLGEFMEFFGDWTLLHSELVLEGAWSAERIAKFLGFRSVEDILNKAKRFIRRRENHAFSDFARKMAKEMGWSYNQARWQWFAFSEINSPEGWCS
jgi:hypothetical protein